MLFIKTFFSLKVKNYWNRTLKLYSRDLYFGNRVGKTITITINFLNVSECF